MQDDAPTIPPHPEVKMHGAKQVMQVNIVECNRGGFIVVLDGGTAARSTWGEALEFIAEHGVEHLGWGISHEEKLPEGIKPTHHQVRPERPPRRLLHSISAGLMTFLGARSTA